MTPVRHQDVRFPGRSGPNGDFIWFDPMKDTLVFLDVSRHGCKRPAPPTARHDKWKTVPPSFDTTTEPLAETASAATTPEIDPTSDLKVNEANTSSHCALSSLPIALKIYSPSAILLTLCFVDLPIPTLVRLTEEHDPVLLRFFYLVTSEPSSGFAGTLVRLARQ